jgi:hypothetical protein
MQIYVDPGPGSRPRPLPYYLVCGDFKDKYIDNLFIVQGKIHDFLFEKKNQINKKPEK